MLRNKAGQMALIVGCFNNPKYIGRIVTCEQSFWNAFWGSHAWEVDIDIGGYVGIADKHLMPINDPDGEDEMLRISGKPEQVAA